MLCCWKSYANNVSTPNPNGVLKAYGQGNTYQIHRVLEMGEHAVQPGFLFHKQAPCPLEPVHSRLGVRQGVPFHTFRIVLGLEPLAILLEPLDHHHLALRESLQCFEIMHAFDVLRHEFRPRSPRLGSFLLFLGAS